MDGWWQGYDLTASDEEARKAFVKKYGRPPAQVERDHSMVRAGPLSEEMLAGRMGMKLEPATAG